MEIIQTELISRHHNNLLAGHFGIEKTQKLVARKYYWSTFCHDVKYYVKVCNICLALKAVRHKPYDDLQYLPICIYRWKNLLMDFVTGLLISTDWKQDNYDSIFIIVKQLSKMIYYKLVKVTIDTPGLAEVIINVIVRHPGLPNSIVTNRGLLFTSKFWLLLCYFLGIKQKLSTTFQPQIDGQTDWQNSTIEAYLWAFINFNQDNWARLLSMAEFTYNNSKNASTGHTPFELNCGYHLCLS